MDFLGTKSKKDFCSLEQMTQQFTFGISAKKVCSALNKLSRFANSKNMKELLRMCAGISKIKTFLGQLEMIRSYDSGICDSRNQFTQSIAIQKKASLLIFLPSIQTFCSQAHVIKLSLSGTDEH